MSRVGNYHSKEREKEIMWIYIVFFLLIMFCIVNLLSGFYFTKLIKHFFKALPIFLKDLYVMDRDVFRRLSVFGVILDLVVLEKHYLL